MIKFKGFIFTDDETGINIEVDAINNTVSGATSEDELATCSFYAGVLYAGGAEALKTFLKDKNITS